MYDNCVDVNVSYNGNCILLVNKSNIQKINEFTKELIKTNDRINIVLEDIESFGEMDIKNYGKELDKLVDIISAEYSKGNVVEVNILTDRINIKSMHNCDCGNCSFALAPNGKFYICPAFYFDNPDDSIGDLDNGISIKNGHLLELKNAPICTECDAYHCKRCKFLNKKLTNEINTPSKIECIISHIERNKARSLQLKLKELSGIDNAHIMPEIDYLDPFEKIINYKYFPNKSI